MEKKVLQLQLLRWIQLLNWKQFWYIFKTAGYMLSPINFVPIELFQSQWYLIYILRHSKFFKRNSQIRYNVPVTQLISTCTEFISLFTEIQGFEHRAHPTLYQVYSKTCKNTNLPKVTIFCKLQSWTLWSFSWDVTVMWLLCFGFALQFLLWLQKP